MKIYSRIIAAGFILGLWVGALPAHADELVYIPVNPNFGGSPFNGAPLLNSALAQNKHRAPGGDRTTLSTVEQFQASLDRAILSRLASNLVDEAFGGSSGVLTDGTFNTGSNTITILAETVDGVVGTTLTLTDNATGEVTTVFVPEVGN
jgi:curli production assembly/transport component CsgF